MTAIRNVQMEPGDGGGALGVHSLDQFGLRMPDLAVAQAFFAAFGLDAHPQGDRLDLRTRFDDQIRGTILPGPRRQIHHLSFGVFAEDLPRFRRHLEQLGLPLLDPPAGLAGDGLWFRGHDGVLIELHAGPRSAPAAKSPGHFSSVAEGERGTGLGLASLAAARPQRLAHCLLFTPDVPEAVRFYGSVLGLRLSDHSGTLIAFMHAIHGSDHHVLAFAQSNGPGLHHSSWDVGGIEAIGQGAQHMARQGFAKGWGLGRHSIGSNYFHYVQDPTGGFAEYACDVDYIPKGFAWQPRDFPAEESVVLWGPQMPADFIHNYEIDAA